jgi:hypothetical protein
MTLLIPTTDIAPTAGTPSSTATAPLALRTCRLCAVRYLTALREHSPPSATCSTGCASG